MCLPTPYRTSNRDIQVDADLRMIWDGLKGLKSKLKVLHAKSFLHIDHKIVEAREKLMSVRSYRIALMIFCYSSKNRKH